jgi:hypothetical protein
MTVVMTLRKSPGRYTTYPISEYSQGLFWEYEIGILNLRRWRFVMQLTKLSILLITLLLFTLGCGGALNSSSPPITDKLVQARLTDFTVEKGSDLILTMSEAVNIDKQIEARLLQQEKSDDFPDYKYEIILMT